jgi:Tol biopolymer transport system component
MKRIAALFSAIVLCQVLVSCDSGWPYKPVQFIPPVPPPPKHAFIPKDTLDSFCRASNVTLLYTLSKQGVMTQTLYYVHLSDSNATPVRLKKPREREDWNASSPMPSPDGKLVTYYLFPPRGQSAAYIQRVDSTSDPVLIAEPGSDPHFYKDKLGYLYVTYTDTEEILGVPANQITARATYMVQVDTLSGQPNPSTLKNIAKYPFYGGMSRDGRYICTGYKSAAIYDVIDSAYFPIDSGLQTCNPSTTTDSILTDRMMFLNFAGTQNFNNFKTFVNEHKMIFIADKNNLVIKSFDVNTVLGASKGEWQCPEWSNNPDYFAALASEGSNYDIYLVNIKTGKALRLNNPSFPVSSSSTPYVFIAGGAS